MNPRSGHLFDHARSKRRYNSNLVVDFIFFEKALEANEIKTKLISSIVLNDVIRKYKFILNFHFILKYLFTYLADLNALKAFDILIS